MALTANSLPSALPDWSLPFDVSTAFATAQTRTTTGYFDQLGAQSDLGPGRFIGNWVVDVSALDLSSGDETYKLYLLGSNDAAFGNGNVQVLAVLDFAAATAGRLVPTICPASNAVPPTGKSSDRFIRPFTNQVGQFVFRYVQAYAVLAGTTPSITAATWISPMESC